MALGWADVRLWMDLRGKARERTRIEKRLRRTTESRGGKPDCGRPPGVDRWRDRHGD